MLQYELLKPARFNQLCEKEAHCVEDGFMQFLLALTGRVKLQLAAHANPCARVRVARDVPAGGAFHLNRYGAWANEWQMQFLRGRAKAEPL